MSTNSVPEPVAKRLGYALKRAQHALRTRMDDVLRPLDLTTPQYAVLSVIEHKSGISNAGLARAAFVTPQTMTGILSNLQRDKLLSRKTDLINGRILRSELTPAGKKKLAQAHQAVAELEKILLEAVGEDTAAHLAMLLTQCADKLSHPGS